MPADLLDHDTVFDPRPDEALESLDEGHWVCTFHQGQWRRAQLLWTDEERSLWLFVDVEDGTNWALKRPLLERLHGEGLLEELQPSGWCAAPPRR